MRVSGDVPAQAASSADTTSVVRVREGPCNTPRAGAGALCVFGGEGKIKDGWQLAMHVWVIKQVQSKGLGDVTTYGSTLEGLS